MGKKNKNPTTTTNTNQTSSQQSDVPIEQNNNIINGQQENNKNNQQQPSGDNSNVVQNNNNNNQNLQQQQQQNNTQQQQQQQIFQQQQFQFNPYVQYNPYYYQQQQQLYYQQQQHQQQQHSSGDFLEITLSELLRFYLYFVLFFFVIIGTYEEVMSKSSYLHGGIRHYFGMQFFVEYTAADPMGLIQYEDEVAICDYLEVTPKIFFQEYVSKYRPCLFKGYGKQWPAYHKWQNESYLKEMAADEIIYAEMQKDNRFAYFTEGAKRAYLTYGEFLDKFKEPNRTFHYYYSFEDPPGPLKNDIINPPIMDSIFEYKQVTFWQGYGTLTKPHTDAMENMMCVFEGYKNFTIVAPHERKYVYAGFNGVPENYSPVEFVAPDYNKWPDFKKAHVRTVHIAPGDCLYLPAYYWHQVGSSPGVSIGIATWYKTHHQSADLLQFAMQQHIV